MHAATAWLRAPYLGRMAFAVVLAGLLGGWAVAVPAQPLTVSAAASLGDALREIGARFEARRPGVKLRFNFAASGMLLQQIAQGAPVDVLVSADEQTVARGIELKLLDASSRQNLASNTLVMVVPAAAPAAPASLHSPALANLVDLARPSVRRVAVGKPATVPLGRYTQQALQAAQLWGRIEPKLVFGDNARQVLDYVARGEVEAGVVYRTDAALANKRVRVVLALVGHSPITYPALVVAESRQPTLAREFHAFLSGSEAQAVLARFGFGKP
jgi:molybdate transport system substrate-binding protein